MSVSEHQVLGLGQVEKGVQLVLLDLKYEFSELLNLVRVTLALGHLPVQERPVVASLGRVFYLSGSDFLGRGNHFLLLIILEVDSLGRNRRRDLFIAALGVEELVITEALLHLLLILESLVDELFFLIIITVFIGRDLLEVHWGGRILFLDYLGLDWWGQQILVRLVVVTLIGAQPLEALVFLCQLLCLTSQAGWDVCLLRTKHHCFKKEIRVLLIHCLAVIEALNWSFNLLLLQAVHELLRLFFLSILMLILLLPLTIQLRHLCR